MTLPKNKQIIIYLVILLIPLIVLMIPSVTNTLYQNFAGKEKHRDGASQLSFRSNGGDYDIILDGEKIDEVLDNSEKLITGIPSGVHELTISRKSDIEKYYYEHKRNIDFLPSAEVKIEWESGPTLESSSGIIRYYTNIIKDDGAQVYILPFPIDSKVEFNGAVAEDNVFDVNDTNNYQIGISNGQGFDKRELQVNLSDGDSGQVLTNLRLLVEVYLYKQPFI